MPAAGAQGNRLTVVAVMQGAVREGGNRWVSVFKASSADAFSNYYRVSRQGGYA